MSLPDYLLDPKYEEFCESCNAPITNGGIICSECENEIEDVYADEKISERRVNVNH